MKPIWEKCVHITASNHESGVAKLRIVMGATGPRLVLSIDDERIVIATRWNVYTRDHTAELVAAIAEGVEQLKKGES